MFTLNTSVIKTSNVNFTIEKSNEIVTDLSYNMTKSKIGKQTSIRKKQRHTTQESVIILGDSMVKH